MMIPNLDNELFVADLSNGAVYQVVDNSVVVPVELISFDASAKREQVIVSWNVTNEINFEGYEISRSKDGTYWESVGTVESKKSKTINKSYSWIDKYPYQGLGYYRLKMIDKDGSYRHSSIKKVIFKISDHNVSLYPNPISPGSYLTVASKFLNSKENTVSIFSLMGERVHHLLTNDTRIVIPSTMTPGYYIVRINDQGVAPLIIGQ